MQSAQGRQLFTLVILVATALLGLWYMEGKNPATEAPGTGPRLSVHVVAHSGADTLLSRTLETHAPLSALSALEQAAAMDTVPLGFRQYSFGRLVVSIGGVTAGSSGDWTYRVNDTLPPLAAESCPLSEGDRLEFRFGETSDTTALRADSS